MTRFYKKSTHGFTLFQDGTSPSWRPPQLGALGALLGHWAVHAPEPALIAVPTGSGKTAIALAAPYIAKPRRTLVVVPSTQLRHQTGAAFRDQAILRQIGALSGSEDPKVLEVTGRLESWHDCDDYDVVVALPQSISPEHYPEAEKPPIELFDLVIVDEAHHAPARTWRAILEHFAAAKKVLLTATPVRRDGKHVPGETVFHYPLRSAIADGYYRKVEAKLVEGSVAWQRRDFDVAIRNMIISELEKEEHATSALLVRGSNRSRVAELVELYSQAGIEVVALTSNLGEARQAEVIDNLRAGRIRAVAVVGMLGEGFDLPRLRLAAYHDKHKSVTSTVQLIGRLVRNQIDFPQPSLLVAARDDEVYPALKGALWSLYQEDADWSSLLPEIMDTAIQNDRNEREFARELAAPPSQLSVESIRPLVRATVYEAFHGWEPSFIDGTVPEEFVPGEIFRGQEILYVTLTPGNRTLLLVTQGVRSPRWNADSGLDSPEYALHLITFLQSSKKSRRPLLFVNSSDATVMPAISGILDLKTRKLRPAAPERLHRAFDMLPRLSVSNIGVRNTYGGGRGSASYKMFAGSGVDRGMREADTAQAAIGHAMAQVGETEGTSAYHTGFSVERAKIWESRYVPLRDYDGVFQDFAERYWSSKDIVAPLLPSVARGVRLVHFPDCDVVTIELHPLLLTGEWTTLDGFQISRLDFQWRASTHGGSTLEFEAVRPDSGITLWVGLLDSDGTVSDAGAPVDIRRGYETQRTLAELLTAYPPTVYFLNGETVSGATLYRPPAVQRDLTRWKPTRFDWTNTNIQKETDRSAAEANAGNSIHETLRAHLSTRPTSARWRWVLDNDGRGELADLVVLEIFGDDLIEVELWHAKAAGGTAASVRVSDIQVVVAQAIKSRRWLTDRDLWQEMADRHEGNTSPKLKIVHGQEGLLKELLGLSQGDLGWSLINRPMQVRGKVVIAQPGLSWSQLERGVESNDLSATQIRDLIAVFDDSLGALGDAKIVCSE